jgi:ABC-type Fe3+/spermidine/putrescine transport system ATPase subunit
MGRAIVRPEGVLMDEPLSNLDAKLRVQMRTGVSRLQKSLATTTVYVTHDQTEAMTLGDRVAVMRAGELQPGRPATPSSDHPQNLFVAGSSVPGDELHAGDARRRHYESCRSATCACPTNCAASSATSAAATSRVSAQSRSRTRRWSVTSATAATC